MERSDANNRASGKSVSCCFAFEPKKLPMKKILPVVLLVLTAACSSDDGNGGTNPDIALATGTWQLSELRISPAQDINEDGNTTDNVLEELTCVSGTLILRPDMTWSFSGNDVIITTITGGLFKFFCSDQIRTNSGEWGLSGSVLRLSDNAGILTDFQFSSSSMTLTNTLGGNLPELQAEVYSK